MSNIKHIGILSPAFLEQHAKEIGLVNLDGTMNQKKADKIMKENKSIATITKEDTSDAEIEKD